MTPEAAAEDVQRARRRADSTSRAQFSQLVGSFAAAYERGDYTQVWAERCEFGVSVGKAQMSSEDWFWFHAYPALAGLRLRKMPGFPLDNFCAQAELAVSDDDPGQKAAVALLKSLYFG